MTPPTSDETPTSSTSWLKASILFFAGSVLLRLITFGTAPLFDTTESRYANMIQHFFLRNDWLLPYSPTFHQPFFGKPPFSFWLGGLSVLGFGSNEWAFRFPNLIAMLLTLWATYMLGKRLAGGQVGGLAVLLLVSCGFFNAIGMTVSMDMWVCASVMLALLSFFHLLEIKDAPLNSVENEEISTPSTVTNPIFWHVLLTIAISIGVMTKGLLPLVMTLFPLGIWAVLAQELPSLKKVAWHWVILGVLAICVPWFWLVQSKYPDFLYYFFVQEHLLRYITPNYGDRYGSGHIQPYGTSLWYFLVALLPCSVIPLFWLPSFVKNALKLPKETTAFSIQSVAEGLKTRSATTFLWVCLLFPALFFSIAKSILMTYVLTGLPPATILLARFLHGKLRWIQAKTASFFVAGFVTLGIALWFGAWGFDAVIHQPQFGSLLFPDYRSMRSVVYTLKKENPHLLKLPVIGWVNQVPFSWLCYIQQDETNLARRLGWRGSRYTPTFASTYEPYSIETIEALKSQPLPFMLMTWERDVDQTAFLDAHWPKHLTRKMLHKAKKGVKLYLVTSAHDTKPQREMRL
ncbi:MAG: glycosyltransferase family 39 protein [Vampirovibrionales bacterium]|nr:glycosyltransferase family 39 protein [Vampirovibrionales bacterium]